MGAMKELLLEQIDDLSEITGYSVDFLLAKWNECMENGDRWSYFKSVTLEHDW